MRGSRLWFIVPAVALWELGTHLWISVRAPDPSEWAAIAGPVRRLATPGTAIVVAPRWAEPLARHVLGDELWSIADLARPNDRGVRQVVEISLFGATDPATATWPVERQLSEGEFRFTSRKNPHYEPALFSLVDAVTRAEPTVTVYRRVNGTRYPCTWRQNLPPSTGGLHGHVAFPRERYLCGRGQDEFVGITLIDDEHFEPRQCVWIHAPRHGEQWLALDNVPLGRKLELYAGSSYFLMRDGTSAPVTIEVLVDGSPAGKAIYRDPEGWAHFAFETPRSAPRRGRLEFKISSQQAGGRSVCLAAETR